MRHARPRSSTSRALLAAAALALLATACGGDTEPGDDDTADTAVDEATDGEDDATDADEDDTTDAPDGDDGDAADATDTGDDADEADGDDQSAASGDALGMDELTAIFEGAQGSTYQVEYAYEQDGAPEGMTMTIAHDPPATVMEGSGGPEGRYRVITDGESSVFCIQSDGSWQCFTQSLEEGAAGGFLDADLMDDFAVVDPEDLEDAEVPERIERRTLLDRDAVCITTSDYEGFDGEICLDEATGALLLAEGDVNGEMAFRMAAVSFSDPDPALFEPPAEPQEFSFGG